MSGCTIKSDGIHTLIKHDVLRDAAAPASQYTTVSRTIFHGIYGNRTE